VHIKLPVDLVFIFNEKVSITPPRPFQSVLFYSHDLSLFDSLILILASFCMRYFFETSFLKLIAESK
jgi:hypothetical protein